MNKLSKEELLKITNYIGLDQISKMEQISIGFNNLLFNIDDRYVLKVCATTNGEPNVLNEISFYNSSNYDFHPQLISFNTNKNNFPYIFILLEKVKGTNLVDVWGSIDIKERQEIISKITDIMKKLHSVKGTDSNYFVNFNLKIKNYIERLANEGYLSTAEIDYLLNLSNVFENYIIDSEFCFVHGDIHFNNIIYNREQIKLLDYEFSSISPIEKEFDSINRMCQDPNGLIQKGNKKQINPEDYKDIMGYFRETYPEVVCNKNFNEKVLTYNCANALRWMLVYPSHQLYKDVLFEKSKALMK